MRLKNKIGDKQVTNIAMTAILSFCRPFSPIVPISEMWICENLWLSRILPGKQQEMKKEYMNVNCVCWGRNSPHPECLKLKEHEEDWGRRTRRRCANSCCVQLRTVGPLGSIPSPVWGEAKKKKKTRLATNIHRWAALQRGNTHTHALSPSLPSYCFPSSCLSPASSSCALKLFRLFSAFILLLFWTMFIVWKDRKMDLCCWRSCCNVSKHAWGSLFSEAAIRRSQQRWAFLELESSKVYAKIV